MFIPLVTVFTPRPTVWQKKTKNNKNFQNSNLAVGVRAYDCASQSPRHLMRYYMCHCDVTNMLVSTNSVTASLRCLYAIRRNPPTMPGRDPSETLSVVYVENQQRVASCLSRVSAYDIVFTLCFLILIR